MSNIQSINLEFYVPHEVQLDNICVITLFKKVLTESFYEHRDTTENFKKDEDLFISWLASIASSRNYPLARALLVDNGFSIEAIYTSIKPKHFVEHPCLSRVRRIYVIDKLKTPDEMNKPQINESTEELTNNQKPKEAVQTNLLLDFANDELYIFFSPIIINDSTKAEALVIETDRGIEFIRLDSISSASIEPAKTSKRKSKGKNRKKKKRKKKTGKASKTLS